MSLESCLNTILPAYKEFRKSSLDKHWLNLKSYIKRSFGSTTEFARLLSLEAPHYGAAGKWIDGYLQIQSIKTKHEVELLISYLKSFKDRSGSRGTFLVLIAALVALTTATMPSIVTAICTGGPLLLALFERHYLNEHISYANDLAFLLEQKKSRMAS